MAKMKTLSEFTTCLKNNCVLWTSIYSADGGGRGWRWVTIVLEKESS